MVYRYWIPSDLPGFLHSLPLGPSENMAALKLDTDSEFQRQISFVNKRLHALTLFGDQNVLGGAKTPMGHLPIPNMFNPELNCGEESGGGWESKNGFKDTIPYDVCLVRGVTAASSSHLQNHVS